MVPCQTIPCDEQSISLCAALAHHLHDNMATYNPLKIQQQRLAQQQAELERQIAALQAQEKAAALQRVRALMSEFGISADQLMPKSKSKTPRIKPSDRAGRKSNAVYRDPASAATWGGHGRRPAWVVQWLAQGRRLDELAS
jgi:DNA-binding protein H-NS